MQIVRLLIRHDCPFSGPLSKGSAARVTHLCHRGAEAILEVHGPEPEEVRRLTSEYSKQGGTTLFEVDDASAALVRFPSCACCRSGRIIPTLEGLGFLYLPPSGYTSEGERYQFLAPTGRFDADLPGRLPPGVHIEKVGTEPLVSLEFEEGFLVPVGSLFRSLTDRQRRAIVSAIRRGYYRIPRGVAAEEIAREFGISRAAFDTLLRKAENKLASALFPYLAVQGFTDPVPSDPDGSLDPVPRRRAGGRGPA